MRLTVRDVPNARDGMATGVYCLDGGRTQKRAEQTDQIRCPALHFFSRARSLPRSARNDVNPPGPTVHPPLARGTFSAAEPSAHSLPPLLKGGAAAAAVGFGDPLHAFLCFSV